MWNIGVGFLELSLFLGLIISLAVFRSPARRWLTSLLAITTVAIFLTPADIASTLIVAVPLSLAFVAGVCASPLFNRVQAPNEK